MPERKPSTAFLVILNGLLFFGVGAVGTNTLGLFVMIFATAVFMAVSWIWHFAVLVMERRWRIRPAFRTILFILPFLVLLILPYLGIGPPQAVNKQRPAVSRNGNLEARVNTKEGTWEVRIRDLETDETYEEQTDFVAHLNVYWIWDDEDVFWVYNSDDGTVHAWIRDGGWMHIIWDEDNANLMGEVVGKPPIALFPDYALGSFSVEHK